MVKYKSADVYVGRLNDTNLRHISHGFRIIAALVQIFAVGWGATVVPDESLKSGLRHLQSKIETQLYRVVCMYKIFRCVQTFRRESPV